MEKCILITVTEDEETNEGSMKVEWDPEFRDFEAISCITLAVEIVRSRLMQKAQAGRVESKIIKPNFLHPKGGRG